MLLGILVASALAGAPQLRMVVNVPAYRLDVYLADSLVARTPVAVGMRTHPTPRGTFAITSVEWNPWWNPPDEPWAAGQRLTPPGPDNPMGRVKLNFRPLYYMHGTPLEASIGSAASHGCIRLRNESAIALAELVERFSASPLSSDAIARITAAHDTRTILVDPPVPVEVRYDLVEVLAERVFVYRDIYGLGTRTLARAVVDALGSQGIESQFVDTVQVRSLVQHVGASGKSAAIADLLLPLPSGDRGWEPRDALKIKHARDAADTGRWRGGSMADANECSDARHR